MCLRIHVLRGERPSRSFPHLLRSVGSMPAVIWSRQLQPLFFPSALQRVVDRAVSARSPDQLLLAVAGTAFLIGGVVVMRRAANRLVPSGALAAVLLPLCGEKTAGPISIFRHASSPRVDLPH